MCKKWKEVGTLGQRMDLAAVHGVRQRVGLAAQRQERVDDLRVIKGNECQRCSRRNSAIQTCLVDTQKLHFAGLSRCHLRNFDRVDVSE